jgi:hypothetical protein
MTTDTDARAFEDVIAAWDESLICQSIYDCPNTATWLAVSHCNTGADRIVVCAWHRERWLDETRLIIAWHGSVVCDCGRHFTTPESCVKFRQL